MREQIIPVRITSDFYIVEEDGETHLLKAGDIAFVPREMAEEFVYVRRAEFLKVTKNNNDEGGRV